MTKRKAFSYIRMSTEAQLKGHSLQRQMEMTRRYAEEKNLDLIEDLKDIGLSAHSGKNITSGQLGRFLNALQDGEIERGSILIVESLDRLSRKDPMIAFNQLSFMMGAGLEVHTISDGQIYSTESMKNDVGKLFTSLGYMLRAYSESEEKSKRLQKRWDNKRNNLETKILTTVAPAWLKPKPDKSGFEIDPYAASVVKKIFEMCIEENMGTFSITKYLNNNIDIYPKFTQSTKANRSKDGDNRIGWQKSYVQKILNNPAVYGEFTPNKLIDGKRVPQEISYERYFPTVISEKDFYLAQSKMKNRAIIGGGRKGESFSNVFTKMLTCGFCDAPVHYQDKGEGKKGGQYLRCSNALMGYKCNCIGWEYSDFERNFFSYISHIDFEELLATTDVKNIRRVLIDKEDTTIAEIKNLEKKFEKLLDLQLASEEDEKDIFNAKKRQISNQLKTLQNTLENTKVELRNINSSISIDQKDKFLDLIINLDVTHNDQDKIAFRRKLNAIMLQAIEKVKLYPQHDRSALMNPWEAEDLISDKAKKALEELGYKDSKSLELLFSTHEGSKLLNNIERYFVVKFKNGIEQTIRPYFDLSTESNYSKLIAFKNRAEKNLLDETANNQVSNSQARKIRKNDANSNL